MTDVQIMTQMLKNTLCDNTIFDWTIVSGKYVDTDPKGFSTFQNKLPLMVENVDSKGNFIHITLYNEDGKYYIIQNLRGGEWSRDSSEEFSWSIELNNDEYLYFTDPENVSTVHFTSNSRTLAKTLNKLGMDILGVDFNYPDLCIVLDSRKDQNITTFLMDKKNVTGCDNRIKCEILYNSKLSPKRTISTFTSDEIKALYNSMIFIPRVVYNTRLLQGVTDGTEQDLLDRLYKHYNKIYDRKDAKKTKTLDGNVTFWDPKIQK